MSEASIQDRMTALGRSSAFRETAKDTSARVLDALETFELAL